MLLELKCKGICIPKNIEHPSPTDAASVGVENGPVSP